MQYKTLGRLKDAGHLPIGGSMDRWKGASRQTCTPLLSQSCNGVGTALVRVGGWVVTQLLYFSRHTVHSCQLASVTGEPQGPGLQ